MTIKCSDFTSDFFENHPVLKNHTELLTYIGKKFQNEDDVWILKIPGRVNLIGEHVDYNNGPVLPCAIDRELIICLKENTSGMVHVSNVNSTYPDIEFSTRKPIESYEKGQWGNYIKAGVKGIVDFVLKSPELDMNGLSGFDAIVSSTLPQAAGLSSSSTLVVGAALAVLTVNEISLDKLQIAEICAEAEHFVGTSGGGMDHAAILLGKTDSFSKIEFNPLTLESISAPSDIAIILFHSLVEAEKSSYVREAYNRRVLECNFALNLYNQFISNKNSQPVQSFKYLGDIAAQKMIKEETQIELVINDFLGSLSETYSLSELIQLFGVSKDQLADQYKHVLRGADLKEISDGYHLKKRFWHVYTECQRVNQAVELLKANDTLGLGKLLDASHHSLSNDYNVSTPEIDAQVKMLKNFGAFGARLVGAGFGGMILVLSDHSHTEELILNMQKSFYSRRSVGGFNETVIRCNTADGAGLIYQ